MVGESGMGIDIDLKRDIGRDLIIHETSIESEIAIERGEARGRMTGIKENKRQV